jgi:catechol 2,3-dioxygenase-like lactoylglutathione lyase family enzyme
MADGHGLVRNVPILTGRSLPPMISLWQRLGLHVTAELDGEYAILATREAYDPEDPDGPGDGPGAVEVHLSAYPDHDPYTTAGSVYLRVRDAQSLYQRLHDQLDAEGLLYLAPASGITESDTAVLRAMDADGVAYVRLHEIETKPWGTHEFAVVDPEGNLVRIGTAL